MTARSELPAVGVNLTWLVPGVVGGSEEYTVRLLEAVHPLIDGRLRLRLYVRPEFGAAHPRLLDRQPVVTAPAIGSKPGRVALEHTWLAAVSAGDDVVHHAGGTVPYLRSAPAIVTIHDLQPLEMPENFGPVKRAWLARAIPHAARSARLVLCPSRFTADRLQELLGIPEERVRIVRHGHRPTSCRPTGAVPGPGPVQRFGRYLLYPAIAYRHKRHVDAVQALARLGPGFDDVKLVLTGRPGPELETVLAEASLLGVGGRVVALGRVPAAELDELYRSAVALVFPSSYEGFGNPALEAMSVGCPVLAADAGALPEVIDDAGLLFPVGDSTALADAIARVLGEPALAGSLRERGLARARAFDAGIAARQLADVYCEVADSRHR